MVKTDFSCPASSWNGTGMWPLSPDVGAQPLDLLGELVDERVPPQLPVRDDVEAHALLHGDRLVDGPVLDFLVRRRSSWPASNCSRASFRYGGRSSDPMVSARYTVP
jgi:hypothetical protein